MRQTDLSTFLCGIETRKALVGFDESAPAIESRRNKGGRRTASKRALLRRNGQRAEAANLEPIVSY